MSRFVARVFCFAGFVFLSVFGSVRLRAGRFISVGA
jgi:hypothetical protein